MEKGRIEFLRELWKQRFVRWGGGTVGAVAGYDAASSQFAFPKLGSILPWISTSVNEMLLPWWGWLLILQAIFVYGLFEYVRLRLVIGIPLATEPSITNQDEGQEPSISPATDAPTIADKTLPDVPINTVLGRVEAYLASKSDVGTKISRSRVNLEIMDKIVLHHLTVWARNRQFPIEKISHSLLESARLDAYNNVITTATGGYTPQTIMLTDIQFVSSEISSIWPNITPEAPEGHWPAETKPSEQADELGYAYPKAVLQAEIEKPHGAKSAQPGLEPHSMSIKMTVCNQYHKLLRDCSVVLMGLRESESYTPIEEPLHAGVDGTFPAGPKSAIWLHILIEGHKRPGNPPPLCFAALRA